MEVKRVIELLKDTVVATLPIRNNEKALISLTYLSVCEIYRRLNLSIKAETIVTNSNLALYNIKDSKVDMLIALFDDKGKEMTQTDVIDTTEYDFKLINYRSFILRKPKDSFVNAVYKASPIEFKDEDDVIDLPESMFSALLSYVGHLAHSSINNDQSQESMLYLNKFDRTCIELENQGYKIPLNTDTMSIANKGYV